MKTLHRGRLVSLGSSGTPSNPVFWWPLHHWRALQLPEGPSFSWALSCPASLLPYLCLRPAAQALTFIDSFLEARHDAKHLIYIITWHTSSQLSGKHGFWMRERRLSKVIWPLHIKLGSDGPMHPKLLLYTTFLWYIFRFPGGFLYLTMLLLLL